MEEIDLKILNHIGRYTVTLRRVVQVLFSDEGNTLGALQRLDRLGYIQRGERALPGNFTYYQLKKKGASAINVSENRAKPKEAKGLAQDLAALWFSCMDEKPKRRLHDAELRSLFGAPKGGNVVHVAQTEGESAVFRLFVPEPDTNLERYTTSLKRSAHQACADERLIRWVERGTYQFAVLINNEERKARLAELVRADDFPDLRILLAIAPSPRDLSLFLPPERDAS